MSHDSNNPFSNSRPWKIRDPSEAMTDPLKSIDEPIPIDEEIYNNICYKLAESLGFESLNEGILSGLKSKRV